MEKLLIYNTQYIDYYIQHHNITREEFCHRCGIDMSVLKDMYEQKNMNMGKITRLLNVLNISMDTFLFREKFHNIKI